MLNKENSGDYSLLQSLKGWLEDVIQLVFPLPGFSWGILILPCCFAVSFFPVARMSL